MRTKKINFHWQSVLLGMVLCMVLVIFVGGKANAPQTTSPDGSIKAAIDSELLTKSIEMHKQISAMNKDLTRIEKKIDETNKTLSVIIKIMWPDLKKK